MTYKQLIEAEIADLTERIDRGKGTWPKKGYVQDETWAEWLATRSTLLRILREGHE